MSHGAPTCVGSGRASRLHVLHALLHSTRLFTKSWADACALLSGTTSITSDMGTEGYLCGVGRCELRDLIPYAQTWSSSQETCAAASDDEGTLLSQVFEQEALAVDLSLCLPFPGLLHIADNAFKTLESALQWYQSFFESLQVVTSFLSNPWSKQRIIETCLLGEWSCWKDVIAKFSCKAYKPRWGTVWRACSALEPLAPVIRRAWRKERFLFAHTGKLGAQTVEITAFDEAMASERFWQYLHMINLLAGSHTGA